MRLAPTTRLVAFASLLVAFAVPYMAAEDAAHRLDDLPALEREAQGDDAGALAWYRKRLEETWIDPASRILAEVYLQRAMTLTRMGGAAGLAAVLERLAPLPAPPEQKARLEWALLQLLLRTGRAADARAAADRLGFVRDWRILGPFDNEAGRGFLDVYAPESEADPATVFDGDVRKVQWRSIRAADPTAYVNLDARLRPNDEVLAYASCWLRVDAPTPAILRIGSDEGVKAWLNGEAVWTLDARRPAGFDQDRVPVVLRPGWNRVLLKIAESKGEWGFRFRVTDGIGVPLAGLTAAAALPDGAAPATLTPAGAPAPPFLPDLAEDLLERRCREHPEDPRNHFHLALLRQALESEDRARRSEVRLLRNAITGAPEDPHYRYFLALALKDEVGMSAEREENHIRQELEVALRRFPRHAAAARELAWYYSRTTLNIHKALEYAELACRINPDSVPSRLLHLELLKVAGLAAPAELEMLDVGRRFPDHPMVLGRLAQRAFERADYAGALARFEQAVVADPLAASQRIGLAECLLHLGKLDEARAEFSRFLEVDPCALAAHLQMARVDESRGRWQEAAEAVRRALEICPEEEALVARLGTQTLMLGRADEGLRLLREALRLDPNASALREYVEILAGNESSLDKMFRVDPAAVLAGRPKGLLPAGKGAVCLLNNVGVRVNRDGTQARYEQRLFLLTSAEGVRDFDFVALPYAPGEQKLTVLTARLHHPDGRVEDARTPRTEGGGGEVRAIRRFNLDLPVLDVGDAVELEYMLEDLHPSFFGDYFGDVVVFGLGYECADFRYTLMMPAERPVYFRPVRLDVQPEQEKTPDGRFVVHRWRLRDLPSVDPEPDMPAFDQVLPSLEISTFKSWKEFTVWYWNLIKNQQTVDEAIRAKVREIVEKCPTEAEKVRAVYHFVTNAIRYNAWEFGVHGYQPYTVTQIFQRQFGDCKDKALLLCVMLREIGIAARPVLIYAEDRRSHLELPFPLVERFNHCIAAVTRADKSLHFLDATATFHGVNTIPSMDQGAPVLLVDEHGGEIVATPLGDPDDDVREEWLDVTVAVAGPARLVARISITGPRAVDVRWRYSLPEKRKLVLERDLAQTWGEVRVEDTRFANLQKMEQPAAFSYQALVPAFTSPRDGGRIAFRPTGTLHRLSDSCTLARRKYDLLLEGPWRDLEHIEVKVPSEARPVTWPDSKTLETPFGRFVAAVAWDPIGRVLRIDKDLRLAVRRVSAADYPAYRAFCNAVDEWESQESTLER